MALSAGWDKLALDGLQSREFGHDDRRGEDEDMSVVSGLLALALGAAPTQSVRMTAPQLLAVGERLQREGQEDRALSLYRGLAADPSPLVRAEALARRARILADRGRTVEAAVLMRQVVDTAPRAGAARIGLAQLLEKLGDLDGARRQLRAAQAGDMPVDLARIAERYANALQARAPYGGSVEFGIAPDSNVNRATRSSTLGTVIGDFDLSQDSKARSGVGVTAKASAFARLGVSDSINLVARIDGSHDRYRESEFNRSTLSVAAGPELALGRTRIAVDAGVGQARFGGATFQRWAHASARLFQPLGQRTAATLGLSGARIDNRLNDLQDGHSWTGSIGLERAMTANVGLQLNLSASRFAARDPGYSTRSLDAGIGGWIDLGRVTLSAAASKGRLEADERLLLFPEKRRDSVTRFSLGATTRSLQWMSFSPFVRAGIERNASSVEIWDYRRRSLTLGVRRAF